MLDAVVADNYGLAVAVWLLAHFSHRYSAVGNVLSLMMYLFFVNRNFFCSLSSLEFAHLHREQGNESCSTAHTSVCAETTKES